MARPPRDQPLLLSVLDRLSDEEPDRARDSQINLGDHLAALRSAVRRDLEALLNARQRCMGWAPELTELEQSVAGYGIPDFSGANLVSAEHRATYLRAINQIIARFEPRFRTVRVTPLTNADALDRTLRFRIYAEIEATPAPEPVIFDSVLDPSSRNFAVASADNA